MLKISSFHALRPTRDKVHLIAARPYNTYSNEEIASRLRDNPYSFLHIVNPGYKYNKEDMSEEERFRLVRNRYLEFKEENYFIKEEKPSLYIYKIINEDGYKTTGLISAINIEQYKNGLIKKHEETLKEKEEEFERYVQFVGFNPEPVLLTYSDNEAIDEFISEIIKRRSEYEFTTRFRSTHYLWRIDDESEINKLIELFSQIGSLYIADGHHRTASALNIYETRKKDNLNHTGEEPYNYLMSYLIPESDLRIYAFNRLIKNLNGMTKEEFLIKLDTHYKIEKKGLRFFQPMFKKQFSMYLDGEYYALTLRKNICLPKDLTEDLDANILYNTILKPILGINDIRNVDRVSYSFSKNNMSYIQAMVDRNEYKVGFGLSPVSIKEIKSIADRNLTMPPKTTYIEPKLRNGITIYEY